MIHTDIYMQMHLYVYIKVMYNIYYVSHHVNITFLYIHMFMMIKDMKKKKKNITK